MLRGVGRDGAAQSQDLMKHQRLYRANPGMAESHTKAFVLPLSLILRSLHPSDTCLLVNMKRLILFGAKSQGRLLLFQEDSL